MRHLISLKEQSPADLLEILHIAQKIKSARNNGETLNLLSGKTLIMLFQKNSTRTRISFEAAMTELGGHAIFVDYKNTQFSLCDFDDEIQAVMRYGHALVFRANKAVDVMRAASFNRIPVIDACSEKYHPAQAISDLLTMSEHSNGLHNVKKIAWLGVENNVSNTLMLAAAKLRIKVAIAAPEKDLDSVDQELNYIADSTGMVTRTTDVIEAVSGADYIHTDTWLNMEFFENGKVKPQFEKEYERRKSAFLPFQLNGGLIDHYAPNAKIMHCMPCHVGHEITRDAIDHKNSIIFDQAENRMHAQKAILVWLLQKNS